MQEVGKDSQHFLCNGYPPTLDRIITMHRKIEVEGIWFIFIFACCSNLKLKLLLKLQKEILSHLTILTSALRSTDDRYTILIWAPFTHKSLIGQTLYSLTIKSTYSTHLVWREEKTHTHETISLNRLCLSTINSLYKFHQNGV